MTDDQVWLIAKLITNTITIARPQFFQKLIPYHQYTGNVANKKHLFGAARYSHTWILLVFWCSGMDNKNHLWPLRMTWIDMEREQRFATCFSKEDDDRWKLLFFFFFSREVFLLGPRGTPNHLNPWRFFFCI